MPVALAILFFFGILTLWIPAYWPVTVFQVGLFILTVATVWRERRSLTRFNYPVVPLLFAVLWGLVQLGLHREAYAFDTKTAIVKWVTFLCVFVVGTLLFRDPEARRGFQTAMLWFSLVVAVEATVQAFTGDGKIFWIFQVPFSEHAMGPILSANHWAVFIEAVLPIALYRAFRDHRERLLYSTMAAVMYASVLASTSRMGNVLVSLEIVVLVLLMWARHEVSRGVVTSVFVRLLLFVVVFGTIIGWGRLWERFREPDPMHWRTQFNQASVEMIKGHRLFGVGLGSWPTVYPRYEVIDVGMFANQAHNDWLEWTAEGGLPFGIAMLTLFVWCLRPAFRSTWGIGVIAVFLHGCVDYPFSRPALGSWTILVISMLAVAQWTPRGKQRASERVLAEEEAVAESTVQDDAEPVVERHRRRRHRTRSTGLG
jgi:O-antigen ligase